jgi:glycosyltransferase involved in cell wall biosynthesis
MLLQELDSGTSRVAIVVQRYGKDIVGGAEAHARILAEKLAGECGYTVEVYTTTAKEYQTWDNKYLPGIEYVNGIQVRRFYVAGKRVPWFGLADRVIRRILRPLRQFAIARPLVAALEWLWVYWQGPVAPELIATLRRNKDRYKKIIFFCYLYHPTLAGIIGLEDKSILIPLAHDEPPFYFSIVRQTLARVKQMIPNTEPEWEMIRASLPSTSGMIVTPAGIGFDVTRSALAGDSGLEDKIPKGSFILYLGRVSAGKGVQDLVEWYLHWKSKRRSNVKLVLAGHLEDSVNLPAGDEVVFLGYVSDDQRDHLISRCTALVNPSPYESLSMIVIEALVAGKPVLARRQCAVFRYYAQFSPSMGLFGDVEEFGATMARLSDLSEPAKTQASREWAVSRFSWPKILETFRQQIEA